MEQMGAKALQDMQIFRHAIAREVRGGEQEPIAGGVIATDSSGGLVCNDVAADNRDLGISEITAALPHRLEESLFLGPADSFLEIESDGHAGRAAGGQIQSLLLWNFR